MGEEKSLTPSDGRSQLDIGKVSSKPLNELLETWQYHSPGKVLEAMEHCGKIDEHDMRILRHEIGRWRVSAELEGNDLTVKVGGEYHGNWLCGDQKSISLRHLREIYDLGAQNSATHHCPDCDEIVVPRRRLIDVSRRPDGDWGINVRRIQEKYCRFCGETLEPAPVIDE